MKVKPAPLLWGVVLIAAVPVWADRIPYPGSAKESPKIEASLSLNRSSVPKMNTPVNAGFRAEPTPVAVPLDMFGAINPFDVHDSKSSVPLSTLFPSASEIDNHHFGLRDFDSDARISSTWRAGKTRDKDGEGKRDNDTDKDEVKKGIVTASIPEPGSLSLLLLGLAAIGFSPRRRRDLTPTT